MARAPLNRKCETPGCDRRHKAKSGCGVHYVRPSQAGGMQLAPL